eukprot:m.58088 g.58088  ORF g.58088 m.58088 type:complete len:640 (+) comp13122_c0_seq1:93-2012(+)
MTAFSLFLSIGGGLISFLMLWATGANDVGNAFGTGVGSGAFTYRTATIIAAIFELAGAALIGANVVDFIQKKFITLAEFGGDQTLFAAGMFSAACGTFIWVSTATYFALPVSTTHAIVGAVVAFVIVEGKAANLNAAALGGVAAGWVISPVLGGIVSAIIYILIKRLVLQVQDNISRARLALPFLMALTLITDTIFVLTGGPELLRPTSLSETQAILRVYLPACGGAGLLAFLIARCYVVPWIANNTYRFRVEFDTDDEDDELSQDEEQFALQDVQATADTSFPSSPTEQEALTMSASKLPTTTDMALTQDSGARSQSRASTSRKASSPDIVNEKQPLMRESTADAAWDTALPMRKRKQGTLLQRETAMAESIHRPLINSMSDEDMFQQDAAGRRLRASATSSISSTSAGTTVVNGSQPKQGLSSAIQGNVADTYQLLQLSRDDLQAEEYELGVRSGALGGRRQKHPAAQSYGTAEAYFAPLTLISACTVAFAHGGNDVANAVGPYGIILDYQLRGQMHSTLPVILNVVGGVAIVVGLVTYGYRVMETVGTNITRLSLSKAFAAQFGASVSILFATVLGLPISSTAVLIGCVAGVGLADGKRDAVDWKVLRKVFAAWIITLPCSGATSAIIYLIMKAAK